MSPKCSSRGWASITWKCGRGNLPLSACQPTLHYQWGSPFHHVKFWNEWRVGVFRQKPGHSAAVSRGCSKRWEGGAWTSGRGSGAEC